MDFRCMRGRAGALSCGHACAVDRPSQLNRATAVVCSAVVRSGFTYTVLRTPPYFAGHFLHLADEITILIVVITLFLLPCATYLCE